MLDPHVFRQVAELGEVVALPGWFAHRLPSAALLQTVRLKPKGCKGESFFYPITLSRSGYSFCSRSTRWPSAVQKRRLAVRKPATRVTWLPT